METNKGVSSAEEIRNSIHSQIDDAMKPRRSNRALAGVVLVGIGAVLMARQMGVEFPFWVFTWPVILIVIGIYIGARHSFRTAKWLFPVIIGSVFLLDEIVPELSFREFIWPVVIISAGLFMIFRPRKKKEDYWSHWTSWNREHNSPLNDLTGSASEDFIDSVSVFGSAKKNVISKDFKGGEITSFFGGTDLNLMQADFTGTITLEITNVFGGSKLIVPPNWNIKSEVVSVFGEVDDKRPVSKDGVGADVTKALKLVGTNVFGGITIKSY